MTVPGGGMTFIGNADGIERNHRTARPPALLRRHRVMTPPIGGAAELSLVCVLNLQNKEKLNCMRRPPCKQDHDRYILHSPKGNLTTSKKNIEIAPLTKL